MPDVKVSRAGYLSHYFSRRRRLARLAVPSWASGAGFWFDLATDEGRDDGLDTDAASAFTDAHSSAFWAPNAAGLYLPFAANTLVRTDLGLLTRPPRRNRLAYSDAISNGYWSKGGGAASADVAAGIFGPATCDALTEDGALTYHFAQRDGIAIAANTTMAFSAYVKPGTRTQVGMQVLATPGYADGVFAAYQLTGDGSVLYASAAGAGTVTASGIELLPDGSYFCWVVVKCNALDTTGYIHIAAMEAGNTLYQGVNGAEALYVSQVQLEDGAFPTSPIVTAAAPVVVDGDLQIGDLTGKLGSGFAGIAQFELFGANASDRILEINDNSGNSNNCLLVARSGGNIVVEPYAAGAYVGSIIPLTYAQALAGTVTLAFSYGTNFCQARAVGYAAQSALTSLAYPAMSKLNIGGAGYSDTINSYQRAKKLAIFPGAQSQTTFDAAFAAAELMAAA